MPLNFHHGDAFKALDAKKGLAGKFEGPASGVFTRSSDIAPFVGATTPIAEGPYLGRIPAIGFGRVTKSVRLL